MRPHFHRYPATRHGSEYVRQPLLRRRGAALKQHLSLLPQHAVPTALITQIQPDGDLLLALLARFRGLRRCLLPFLPILPSSAILLHEPVSFCTSSAFPLGSLTHPASETGPLIPSPFQGFEHATQAGC